MSWLYVPELAGWNSDLKLPQIMPRELSAFVRGKPIAQASYVRACKTGILTTALSGLTSNSLTLNLGVASWISLRLVTPVSLSRNPESAKAQTTPAISGPTSRRTYKQLDLPLCFAKTSRATLPWGSNKSAKTYQQWVIQLRQVYSQRQKSARLISENACSLLPTPTATTYGNNLGGGGNGRVGKVRHSLNSMAAKGLWPTPNAVQNGLTPKVWLRMADKCLERGVNKQLPLSVAVQMWPTPSTPTGGPNVPPGSKWVGKTTAYTPTGNKVQVALQTAVRMWPTPVAHDAQKGNAARVGRFGTKAGGRNLNDEVLMWPTPTVGHGYTKKGQGKSGDGLVTAVKAQDLATATGSLNADWVELLQGLPVGWTKIPGPTDGKTASLVSQPDNPTA